MKNSIAKKSMILSKSLFTSMVIIILAFSFCKSPKTEKVKGSTQNYGKPTAPVQLSYEAPKSLNTGETGTILFEAIPSRNCQNIKVTFGVLEGLEIKENPSFESGPKQAGESFKGSIQVKSINGSPGLLNYEAAILIDGNVSTAITSVSVNSDFQKLSKPSRTNSGYSDGEAETTIKN